ncbi:hypothetical protein VNI00_018330 [Paramarasmius palmivorus]|uniref:DUF6535 domain-containing protein n=1 Tax=Paramarasmius palmivorus TaxID=297713 RepID=A0AAW0AZF7_9AGAR
MHTDHNPTRGTNNGSELKDGAGRIEEEKVRIAYSQLNMDLEREHKLQRQRKEARRRKEEEEDGAQKRKKLGADHSYEKLQVEVKKYDDGMIASYKEDIDTLLVFAGLFSAIVTAFLIESYQWLSEDTTVMILTQISQQLTGTQEQPTPFTPEASSIRINCFWFLSLILSLTSALFGLLCKQWLREHQRDVVTRTPGEDLALRQLRRDSFEKWGVASFLSALPILLEIALMFFFVGVLDLLWTLQLVVFSICLAAIVLSVGLYFLTTILPTITIPRDQARFIHNLDEGRNPLHDFGQLAYQFVCPYKSPQAWAVYKLLTTFPKFLLNIPLVNNLTKTHFRPLWDHIQAQTSSWSMLDLRVVRQFDQEVKFILPFQLQVYELHALHWAVTMFRDSPSMIPHLQNVLETLPRSVAFSAVLNRWDIAMWEVEDLELGIYLRVPDLYEGRPKPITNDLPLHSQEGIELLFHHRLWEAYVKVSTMLSLSDLLSLSDFNDSYRTFVQKLPKSWKNSAFIIPLPIAITSWSHENPLVREQSLGLLRDYEDSWKHSSGCNEERHNAERVAFANSLAEYIVRSVESKLPSVFLTSKKGQVFMRFIHDEIIIRSLYSQDGFIDWLWNAATKKVQEVGQLPDNYFAPLPKRDDPPQFDPVRNFIDTVDPQFDNHHNEDEVPSSPVGSVTENIDIQVLGSCGNVTGEIANDSLGSHPLPLGNEEPANPGDSAVRAAEGIAEGSLIPLSAGEDEPDAVAASDTDQDHPKQATEDGSQVVPSPLKGQGERAKDNCKDQGIASLPREEHRERRRDEGRGWNIVNDPNHLRMHWFRP